MSDVVSAEPGHVVLVVPITLGTSQYKQFSWHRYVVGI